MAGDWFYVPREGETEIGPFSQKQMQDLRASGKIGPDTMVRKKTWMDWQPAASVELAAIVPSPPDSTDSEREKPRTGPVVLRDARPKGRRGLVVALIGAAVLIAAVGVGIHFSLRQRGTLSATKGPESAAAAVPSGPTVAAVPTDSWLLPDDQELLDWADSEQIVPPAKESGWSSDPLVEPVVQTTAKPSGSPSSREDREASEQRTIDWLEKQRLFNAAAIKPLDPVKLYAQSKAAVATIHTKDDSGFDVGLGSGFFVSLSLVGSRYRDYEIHSHIVKDAKQKQEARQYAYLLTNHHVIDSAATATFHLSDGRSGSVGDVVMEDKRRDLAVLCIYSRSAGPIATLPIAMRIIPAIGEQVYAIGSPQGLDATLSNGLVTGTRVMESGVLHLQTNAAISPGSSGGPLLDSTGAVIGVVVASHRDSQNLNLAIPAAEVIAFLKGPVNTRKLWQGSGIEEEERDSYASAAWACFDPEITEVESMLLELLSKGRNEKRIGEKSYGMALRTLSRTSAGQPPEWQYLLQFTLGKVAANRAWENVNKEAAKTMPTEEYQALFRNDIDEQLGESCFSTAIQLKPGFSPAYRHLAGLLSLQGRFAEGLEVANQLVRLVPQCPTAYWLRGRFYGKLGRPTEALADFKKATDLGPSDPDTYFELGGAYSELDENGLAAAAYDQAIALQYRTPSICYFNAAMVYMRMGKYQRALTYFEHARGLPGADDKINECRERLK